MVSRKKSKVKARRAAKAAKAAAEDEARQSKSSLVEFGGEQEEVDAEFDLKYPAMQQRMKILAMDREEMAFVESTFETDINLNVKYNAAGSVLNYNIRAAYHATKEEYAGVWNNADILEHVSDSFLNEGTHCVLGGNYKAASRCASLAYCFEQHVACNLSRERVTMSWAKMNELYFDPDEHTLVSFFKKRISCSCLNTKYKQVRSIKKLGICYNFNCPHPGRKVERSLTKCCSLCRRVNYCSRECQVENWNVHWLHCPRYVERDVAAMDLD
eukprot:scaffold11431_cov85-Skeletonema_dohrnii-CCMP3373.AAC.3